MQFNEFRKPEGIEKVIHAINNMDIGKVRIMEVCGTHTMAIAKAGIKSLIGDKVKLISGPGCPVCVTPAERIDHVFELLKKDNVIIATYGDMLKVPGTQYGENLDRYRALGYRVETVYSSLDAVELAEREKSSEVVFLGIGFETTTPGSALAIETAEEKGLSNFTIYSMHKLVEPILRELIAMEDFDVDGFLCPGHVGVILGENGFRFLIDDYRIPSVMSGFEAGDILTSVYKLMLMIKEGKPSFENEYVRLVTEEGNKLALDKILEYFEPCDDLWRGIGFVKGSGLKIKDKYEKYDAVKKFGLELADSEAITACRCGDVIKGKMEPSSCPLFGKTCTPDNAVGPCMVSSEGACAAYYKYQGI